MTQEEKAVLDAALAYVGTVPGSWTGLTPLHEAVRAYRKSLEPAQGRWFVATGATDPSGRELPFEPCLHHMTGGKIDSQAVRGDQATLERMAAMLNEARAVRESLEPTEAKVALRERTRISIEDLEQCLPEEPNRDHPDDAVNREAAELLQIWLNADVDKQSSESLDERTSAARESEQKPQPRYTTRAGTVFEKVANGGEQIVATCPDPRDAENIAWVYNMAADALAAGVKP